MPVAYCLDAHMPVERPVLYISRLPVRRYQHRRCTIILQISKTVQLTGPLGEEARVHMPVPAIQVVPVPELREWR